jgi:hypothetical protein
LPLIGLILPTVPQRGSSVPTGPAAFVYRGIIELREYSEYAACPYCGEAMQFARTVAHADLPPMQTLECKPCGLVVTAEAVSTSMHAIIEKGYYS